LKDSITASKLAWWLMCTVSAILISIAGGWVGSVNAFMPATEARFARQETLIQAVNVQYATIIEKLTKGE